MRLGKFKCCACGHEFQTKPGSGPEAHCPQCWSLYYEGLDYKDWDIHHGVKDATHRRNQ